MAKCDRCAARNTKRERERERDAHHEKETLAICAGYKKKMQVNCGAATVNILIRVCFHCSFTNVTDFPRRAKACQVEQWKITLDYKAS